MRFRLIGALTAIVWTAVWGTPQALSAVDLELRPVPDTAPIGRYVNVGLYAVSDDDTLFSAMDVVLTWDSTLLELHSVTKDSPDDWDFLFGFMPDPLLDGLNDSLLDGDAWFQAASFTTATATADGLLVATFRFSTLADTPFTDIVIEDALGDYSTTQVLKPGSGNNDVTGTLGSASVTVLSEASLSVADVTLPAGRVADIVVSGEINAVAAYGLNIALELYSHGGSTGIVGFTTAPPSDILQIDDPWPGVGLFEAFDTDMTGSQLFNGSIEDNGTYVPAPVTFAGPLASFPVTSDEDARGLWTIRLCTGQCTVSDNVSWWESYPSHVPTALYHGSLMVVELGDGDGSESINVRDFSELQACFTGDVGPVDPPGYAADPALRCAVYDFDEDGDVDADDYVAFRGVMSDPGPW